MGKPKTKPFLDFFLSLDNGSTSIECSSHDGKIEKGPLGKFHLNCVKIKKKTSRKRKDEPDLVRVGGREVFLHQAVVTSDIFVEKKAEDNALNLQRERREDKSGKTSLQSEVAHSWSVGVLCEEGADCAESHLTGALVRVTVDPGGETGEGL